MSLAAEITDVFAKRSRCVAEARASYIEAHLAKLDQSIIMLRAIGQTDAYVRLRCVA